MNLISVDDRRIVNLLQKEFPVCSDPFGELAKTLELDKKYLIQRVQALQKKGFIRRLGAVVNHKKVGASTLASLKVAHHRIDEVAKIVNEYPQVNHNYLREHRFNLWFVVTAADPQHLSIILTEIENRTGCEMIVMPMVRGFFIDTAFKL